MLSSSNLTHVHFTKTNHLLVFVCLLSGCYCYDRPLFCLGVLLSFNINIIIINFTYLFETSSHPKFQDHSLPLGNRYKTQADLEIVAILLFQLPTARTTGVPQHLLQAHSFGGSSPRSIGPLTYGPVTILHLRVPRDRESCLPPISREIKTGRD